MNLIEVICEDILSVLSYKSLFLTFVFVTLDLYQNLIFTILTTLMQWKSGNPFEILEFGKWPDRGWYCYISWRGTFLY